MEFVPKLAPDDLSEIIRKHVEGNWNGNVEMALNSLAYSVMDALLDTVPREHDGVFDFKQFMTNCGYENDPDGWITIVP